MASQTIDAPTGQTQRVDINSYRTVDVERALRDFSASKGYKHAAHAALYCPTDQVFIEKYPIRHVIMVSIEICTVSMVTLLSVCSIDTLNCIRRRL